MTHTNHIGNQMGAILEMHDRTIETVLVECIVCEIRAKERCQHSASNHEVAKLFPGWKILGVRGAKRTLCPKHRNHSTTPQDS